MKIIDMQLESDHKPARRSIPQGSGGNAVGEVWKWSVMILLLFIALAQGYFIARDVYIYNRSREAVERYEKQMKILYQELTPKK